MHKLRTHVSEQDDIERIVLAIRKGRLQCSEATMGSRWANISLCYACGLRDSAHGYSTGGIAGIAQVGAFSVVVSGTLGFFFPTSVSIQSGLYSIISVAFYHVCLPTPTLCHPICRTTLSYHSLRPSSLSTSPSCNTKSTVTGILIFLFLSTFNFMPLTP